MQNISAHAEVLLYAPLWGSEVLESDRIDMAIAVEQLRDAGIELKIFTKEYCCNGSLVLKDNQYVVIFDVYRLFQTINFDQYKSRVHFLAWETPIVEFQGHSDRIKELFTHYYSYCDEFRDIPSVKKTYYPALLSYRNKNKIAFNDKAFMIAVYGNKLFYSDQPPKDGLLWHAFNLRPTFYSLIPYRKSFISFFNDKNLELYGKNWDPTVYSCYKGRFGGNAKTKINFIRKYKFVFCAENTGGIEGYISEKIFDAMIAGSVPIYPDFNNGARLIPKNCFIDPRDFDSLDKLYEYLLTMTETDYNVYLEAINTFLDSQESYYFKIDYFINFIKKIVTSGEKTIYE